MNKLFAFLCVNTMVFTHSNSDELEPSRGIHFPSWQNFTAHDEEEIERAQSAQELEEQEEDQEEAPEARRKKEKTHE